MCFACLVELHLTYTQISVQPQTQGVWRSISSNPSSLRFIPENSSCLMSCFSLLTSDLCLLNSSTQWLLGIGTSVPCPRQCRKPGDNRGHLMWLPFLKDHCPCCQNLLSKNCCFLFFYFSSWLWQEGKSGSIMPESRSLGFFKLILLLDMEDLKASRRTPQVPDAAGNSLSSSSHFLLVGRVNHPSEVSNVFLPSFQWHVKSKAVR